MFAWFKAWKERRELRKLLRSMGSLLHRNYGAQEFYTPEQVLTTCDRTKLNDEAKARSLVMYSEPKLADSFLAKLGRSESANELRKYLIVRCFDGFSEGEEPTDNIFMHAAEQPGIAHGGIFFESDGGGHSGGSSNGGHH